MRVSKWAIWLLLRRLQGNWDCSGSDDTGDVSAGGGL